MVQFLFRLEKPFDRVDHRVNYWVEVASDAEAEFFDLKTGRIRAEPEQKELVSEIFCNQLLDVAQ